MSDHITLDDGRTLSRSSIGVAGALSLIAEHLPEGYEQFRKWLLDVSERSNGFASIDLRGLPEPERRAFHAGVYTAYDRTIGNGMVIGPQSWALTCLDALRAMLKSIERGEPPEALTDVPPRSEETIFTEDLTQFWNTEDS
jgi:hypothetical protein